MSSILSEDSGVVESVDANLENVDFEELFKTYNEILLSHARRKVSDVEIGEDLVQETYIKTYNYLVNGGKIEKMKTFLYQVLNNLIIDQYRKRKDDSLDFMFESHGFDPSFDETEKIFDKFEGENAFLLIEELPENYKQIMKMRYVEDLSLDEISLITGKTKNTVSVNLNRDLEKLRDAYKERHKL